MLSPAYDLNPSTEKDGLALNIDMDDNLAKSVGEFFRLNEIEMDQIIDEVLRVVKDWGIIAKQIGISNKEQQLMENAFKLTV
ncbi:HipA domain-containing protein [Gillisia hiemivivida]|uniref:HipA domain-containing protein n=1 Tax=Gillisia hiemivivida TaxID=291190 RepID=UPI001FE87EFB|nr:HipA domain-containing protein [Gillisia hiemivivida]